MRRHRARRSSIQRLSRLCSCLRPLAAVTSPASHTRRKEEPRQGHDAWIAYYNRVVRRLTLIAFVTAATLATLASESIASADDMPKDYDPRGADGLRVDIDRIVTTEEATGWTVDRSEYDYMHSWVLQSVCRATPEARQLLSDRLASERAVAGNARNLYLKAAKKMTTEAKHALHLERMHTILQRAMADECPFWLEPVKGFDGRQTDRNRVTLNLETGGLFALRYATQQVGIGFGPSARLQLGVGFDYITILGGIELSGAAMLRQDEPGSTDFVLNYLPALPITVHFRSVNWIYSVETGAVSLFQGESPGINFGVRAGFGVGYMALRNRYFTPWAGISLWQELYFGNDDRPGAGFLRGGLRVGVIYDP